MKIVKIKENNNIFEVTLRPNWIKRLFGKKDTTVKLKRTGYTYVYGGGNEYIYQNGKTVGNGNYIGEALDEYIRSW